MQIHLKVSKHQSGRHTLMVRTQIEMQFSDCQEPGLFGNTDAGSFYRAVAAKLHALHQADNEVIYQDASE